MPELGLSLEMLGWTPALAAQFGTRAAGLIPGRIGVEDKHFYVVLTADGELIGQVSGKLLHSARTPADLPKVGDWVVCARLRGEAKVVIHEVLARRTKLSRKVPGREVEEQVLATNVDLAFAVQALDSTFNPALLQRHLVMVFESGAKPVVVLNKADLCSDISGKVVEARKTAPDTALVVVSARTTAGIDELAALIHPGETIVFIGSSGVGKSTLINDLCGEEIQATAEVRERDAKGRHTTSWRELIVLPNGGLVIDTPGMREFQMWVAEEGLRDAFADLDTLAVQCHFRDCSHTVENRCAVLAAVSAGALPPERYHRYIKLRNELAYLEETQAKRTWIQRNRRARVAQRAFNNKPKRQ
jgi:ribosome biogenesis GTPase / thiamine phosphate phosphatase